MTAPTLDLAGLRAAAEFRETCQQSWLADGGVSFKTLCESRDEFHAAANPAVVLALLDRLEAAEAAVARVESVPLVSPAWLAARLDECREEVAERLSWESGDMTRWSETASFDHNRWSWRGDGAPEWQRNEFRQQAEAVLGEVRGALGLDGALGGQNRSQGARGDGGGTRGHRHAARAGEGE